MTSSGSSRDRPLAVVRTAPSYALYLGGSESRLLRGVLERLAAERGQTVVLARNDEQRHAVEELRLGAIVPERAVDGRSLVAFADLLVSAGGTMNREAAVLGYAGVVDLRREARRSRRAARARGAACGS